MLKKLVLLFLCLGCSNPKNEAVVPSTVSVIVDGIFDDKGFNESSSNAMKQLEREFGVNIIEKESRASDYLGDIGGLEDGGSSLIWGLGFKFTDVFLQKARENANVNYAIVEGSYVEDIELPENLVSVNFRSEEGAFLVGYIAAKTSRTGRIGFLGGIEGEVINSFRFGYEAGAKYANKLIDVNVQYVGTFTDLSLGRSIASKMYNDGIDIIFTAAGLSGLGAIEVAKEMGEGYYVIGVDQDQSYLAPDNVLLSYVKRVDVVMLDMTRSYLEIGKWSDRNRMEFGLKDGALDLIFNKSINLNLEEDYDILLEVKNRIVSGEIEVPRNETSYNTFIAKLVS
ncbi:BMP family protein [Borrelia sp. BU AG58]|uniref:BMP family ABC transporter substrate-binding protein n=1 Tax=Borrelia sp. BU AG58 TaxID=2887345 RepID=UPI001E3BBB7F|nr:BMP family protein [Borrelia sp. BU AG58]UER67561.1 BMP family protein [Borrelia sp. BU AG58]